MILPPVRPTNSYSRKAAKKNAKVNVDKHCYAVPLGYGQRPCQVHLTNVGTAVPILDYLNCIVHSTVALSGRSIARAARPLDASYASIRAVAPLALQAIGVRPLVATMTL